MPPTQPGRDGNTGRARRDRTTSSRRKRIDGVLSVLGAIAYELKPCSLPTKGELYNFQRAVQTNLVMLYSFVSTNAQPCLQTFLRVPLLVYLRCGLFLLAWVGSSLLGFGLVFFIVFLIAAVYLSLDDSDRDASELSAYSVFNRGCQAIMGTITAEQFEREILRQDLRQPDPRRRWEQEQEQEQEEEYRRQQQQPEQQGRAVRRVGGKKKRRGYEERLERREQARAIHAEVFGDGVGDEGEWM